MKQRAVALLSLLAGCSDATDATPSVCGRLNMYQQIAVTAPAVESADVLFVVDNAMTSYPAGQATLMRGIDAFIARLLEPPVVRDPMTGVMHPQFVPAKSLHLAVVSTDLGTPGSVVRGCSVSDGGDDGRLNPTRYGSAMAMHPPWTTAPPGARPASCVDDPRQFPSFLNFDPMVGNAATLRDQFVCTAYLSTGGCDFEQPLEAALRALAVHNSREVVGNTDVNAGFVRENAVLAIVVLSDEEDGSTRDCRFAEQGRPCSDAVSVFDAMAPQWASRDLNQRFYLYAPGSSQDPTWPLDRYIDPLMPNRGFTSLKYRHPERVIFGAIVGVPVEILTRTADGVASIDWDALLGRADDGSGGYTGMSAEGPVSMRQANVDPACPSRVVPACRREGSTFASSCDAAAQPFALPSRRVAQVARRFAEVYGNGYLSSVCRSDYGPALVEIATGIQTRFSSRCLPEALDTDPAPCEPGDTRGNCARIRCIVREVLPPGIPAATACTAARGRHVGARDVLSGRDTCAIRQVALPRDGAPPAGVDGFYYDTRPVAESPGCTRHIELTPRASLLPGSISVVECYPAGTVLPAACR